MLKVETKNGVVSMSAKGNLKELCADMLVCIGALYDNLCEQDEEADNSYKEVIQKAVADSVVFKKKEKEEKEESEDEEDELEEFAEFLKAVAKFVKGGKK